MTSDNQVQIVEVGPRDGLQNEKALLPLEVRRQLIERLVDAGLTRIEVGSFVSPRWVPQMQQSGELLRQLSHTKGTRYAALTPNLKGLEEAIASGASEVAVFAAASESFSQKNINCSIAQSIERFRPVMERAREVRLPVRGYISCIVGCPYEGTISPAAVMEVASQLKELGCYELSLGDTIGVATPRQVNSLLNTLFTELDPAELAVHFHDTYGMAIANICEALNLDIRIVDSAVGGLGGCPYATGASGNVATEDVVYLLEGLGMSCGADLQQLAAAGSWISDLLKRPYLSRVGQALSPKS
ncbi:hydroxymethylglutaryl-CoA lyase [Pokkaliibacter sp. CJK22405]|uniref:hydroxymethylglutaryl-CoA lyase n=1 Tax=Pokkaliibacter sp. CJK22405 TaxID=3384615 RepID=UPI003984D1F5